VRIFLSQTSKQFNYYFASFIGIVVVIFSIYFEGIIYSSFILDDFANFKDLSGIKGITDIEGIIGYTFNGVAGKSGRPISLFSFALQANAWPDKAFFFKIVNFAIHIINGYLIYSLILLILKTQTKLTTHHKANLFALFGAFIWLVHPIQVSTVLYSVQRMTELSTLFVLFGLVLYLNGRALLDNNIKSKKGYFYITFGVVLGGYIGVLAKENAILLCLYIILINNILYRNRYFYLQKYWSSIFLYLPLVILFGYLIYISFPYINTEYPLRTFSAKERLLTEFKVVNDYLSLFFFPKPNQFGLFHTDYEIVRNLFSLNALTSTIWICALITTGILAKNKHPLFSFGLLFFFSAHAIESTFLNLEIYFEHRNYLAIFGLIICITYVIEKVISNAKATKIFKHSLLFLIFIWTSVLTVMTYKEVDLWSKPILQAETWYVLNKNSERARINYNFLLTVFGQHKQAYINFNEIFYSDKNSPGEIVMWAQLRCFDKSIPYPPHELSLQKLSEGIYSNAVISSLNEIATLKDKGECMNVNNKTILEYIDAVSLSKHYQGPSIRRNIFILKSKFLALEQQYQRALIAIKNANKIKTTADTLISIGYLSFLAGDQNEFNNTLKRINLYCDRHPTKCLKFRNEINLLANTFN